MGRRKKYNTEEERKAARKAYMTEYRQKNKEKFATYRAKNKDEITVKQAEYYQKNKEKFAEYYQKNKDEILAKQAEYRANHKEEKAVYDAEYLSSPKGRAVNLVKNYRRIDRDKNRGDCTLTADWIVKNIFAQPCHYCGETDWMKLGCDRIDNSLPHTPDNVVCCCGKCNAKKQKTPYDEFMRMIGKVI